MMKPGFNGFSSLAKMMRRCGRGLAKRMAEVQMAMVEEIFRESQERVPAATGRLKESGRIDISKRDRVYIRYGGISVRGRMVNYTRIMQGKYRFLWFDRKKIYRDWAGQFSRRVSLWQNKNHRFVR